MMINDAFSGFSYLAKGFSLLNKPGLKRYVYIPLLINIVFFAIIILIAGHYFGHLLTWLDDLLPGWLHWLNWILWPLFIIAASIFVIYTFVMLANLVGAPFNSLLSEKVETLVIGEKTDDQEGGMISSLKDIPRSVKRQLDIIIYYIPRFLILLILFIIPGINIIASAVWFIFGCWIMAMQYLDYPMDNHKVPFKTMRQQMREKNFKYLAFGCTVTIAMLIPIVNFFAMPAAVIGATLMYAEDKS